MCKHHVQDNGTCLQCNKQGVSIKWQSIQSVTMKSTKSESEDQISQQNMKQDDFLTSVPKTKMQLVKEVSKAF